MNGSNCEGMLDRLPDWAAGRLSADDAEAVRSHVDGCATCREAWEVVRLLAEAGPRPVPAGLEARLRTAVREAAEGAEPRPLRRGSGAGVRPWRVPSWGLAAAAGIVLAVATPVLVERMGDSAAATVDDAEVVTAVADRLPSPWLDDEGIVAGAPVLDDLTDEDLERLLEEMGG